MDKQEYYGDTVTLAEFHLACADSDEMRDIKDAIILEAFDA